MNSRRFAPSRDFPIRRDFFVRTHPEESRVRPVEGFALQSMDALRIQIRLRLSPCQRHESRDTSPEANNGHKTISVPSASFGFRVSPSTLVAHRISLAQTCGEFRPMTPNFQAPRPLHPRAYLRGNPLLASNRRLNAAKSHPYLKTGGWGDNHELIHQLVLVLLVCLFVFEIVGCAGGIKGGTTATGSGSGSTSSGGNGSGGGNTGGSGTTTTIPAAPTGVRATAGNAQVAITWTASSGATSYHVKRATTSAGPFTQISAPTSTNFNDTGLTNGTIYFYVVSALNSAGESANSAAASAKPTAPTQPQSQIPPVPTGLIATAGNAQVSLT